MASAQNTALKPHVSPKPARRIDGNGELAGKEAPALSQRATPLPGRLPADGRHRLASNFDASHTLPQMGQSGQRQAARLAWDINGMRRTAPASNAPDSNSPAFVWMRGICTPAFFRKRKPTGSVEPMGVAWALMRLRNSLLAARAGASARMMNFFLKRAAGARLRNRTCAGGLVHRAEGVQTGPPTPRLRRTLLRLTSFGWPATRSSKSEGWCG